jgi:hypothetical protein
VTANEIKTLIKQRYVGAGLFIDEVGINRHAVRVDLVLVTAQTTNAFEIKAASDDLRRLPSQAAAMENVFDFNYIAVAAAHAHKALDCIPRSFGVLAAEVGLLTMLRRPETNLPHKAHLAQQLWNSRLKRLLYNAKVPGMSGASHERLANAAATACLFDELHGAWLDQLRDLPEARAAQKTERQELNVS